MTSYPDKYSSNITNSTTNRGVEAKETEIANTHLDAESGSPSSPRACASYLQVVVEKHRQRAPPPARAASSPHPAPTTPSTYCVRCGCGAGDFEGAGVGADAGAGRKHGATVAGHPGLATQPAECTEWAEEAEGAECVEVYRFLRVGAALGAGGARGGGVSRWSAGARWRARALAAEAGAAARLALALPVGGALLALRLALQVARDAAQGAVLAVADYALKPSLALLYNALLHPTLVFLANLLQGCSAAARPACGMLAECAQHAATVLAAVRLVELRAPACRCRCRCVREDAPLHA